MNPILQRRVKHAAKGGTSVSLTAQLELDMPFEGGLRPELAGLVAGYRADPSVYDELIDEKGEIRSHWHAMLEHLARLGPEETKRLFETADRHMRDAGVVHRVYDDPGGVDRPWPLSHLPLVLTADDWRALSDGLCQRARLHEALLSDLYGAQDVVTEGRLPAALVAGNSEYLRPLQRVKPAGGRFLHLYAADVSRGPDGRWWVVNDRTQAPSGLGYAIENRIALSRAMPEIFKTLSVERLAGFYQQFRSALAARTSASDPQIALLTPGPLNETYFEHTYLARCLGFLLVEGGDLIVHRDIVYVRTIEGPKRIHALVRRMDADYADPIELNATSRLGVAGLVSAVRAGNIVIANALGSGLCEAPALSGYLPSLAKHLLGEKLLLPNLATWWCGDRDARDHVLENLSDMAILPAFGRTLRGQMDNNGVDGQSLPPSEKARIRQLIESRGIDFVGQEPVRLATTPVWEKGRLQPRRYAIRIFASRGPDGWSVMPGGLCRLSERTDARELSMQRGGRSADVWVMGDRPPETAAAATTTQDDVEINRLTATLPSRAADNLFWLGRYLERADAALRLVRSLIGSGQDSGISDIEERASDRLIATLGLWGAVDTATSSPNQAIESAVASRRDGALPAIMNSAFQTAAAIRDRVSPDAWRGLSELKSTFRSELPPRQLSLRRASDPSQDAALYEDIPGRVDHGLNALAALSGLAHENMNRLGGWHFLDLGTRIERAIAVARFARMLGLGGRDAEPGGESGSLSSLLDLVDAQLAYRSRYLTGPAHKPVLDLVLLDASHPRSLAYQVETIALHLAKIRRHAPRMLIRTAENELDALANHITMAKPAAIDALWLKTCETMLMAISDGITQRYLSGSPAATELAAL